MPSIPSIKKVMTPFPYSVDSMEDLRVARAMMQQHQIRHLPVVHQGRLAGILSEREVQVAQGIMSSASSAPSMPVWAVCTRDPFVVDLNDALDGVVEEMANRHIGSVIVVREGKLAGILTTTDVCRLLAEIYRSGGDPDVVA